MASADNVAASTIIEAGDQTCVNVDTLPALPSGAGHCSYFRSECHSITVQTEDNERKQLSGTYCGEPERVEAKEPHPEEGEELENEDIVVSDVATMEKETPIARSRSLSLGSYDSSIHTGSSSLPSLSTERSSSISLPCSGFHTGFSSQIAQQLREEPMILPSYLIHSESTPDDATRREAPSGVTRGSSTPAVLYVNDLGWGDGTPGRGGLRAAYTFSRRKYPRRVCHHRLNLAQEGPPCYLCSMSDLPPEYNTRENMELKKVRKRLMALFQGLAALHVPQRWRHGLPPHAEAQGTAPPYAISGSPAPTPDALPTTDIDTGGLSRIQLDDNIRELNESSSHRGHQRQSSHVSSSEATQTSDSGSSSDSGGPLGEVPPPYTPPTPGSLVSRATLDALLQQQQQQQQQQQRQQSLSSDGVTNCTARGLLCNIMYAFLLATATTVTVMGLDQPIIVLTSVTILLVVFTFMPLIWCAECLLHWNDRRSLRNTVFSQSQAPFILPVAF